MGTYATSDEIKDASPNIPVVADASDEDLTRWANLAYLVINTHCSQRFDFDQQLTKTARYTWYPDVYFDKVISGSVTVYANLPGQDPELVDNDEEIDVDPGTTWLTYSARNTMNPAFNPPTITLAVTADWGFASSVTDLLVLFTNSLITHYSAHIVSTTYHLLADVTNTVTGTATDLSTTIVKLNAFKVAYNNHIANSPSAYHKTADTKLITAANATTEATAVILAQDIKLKYNKHLASSTLHVVPDDVNLEKFSVDNPIMPDEIKQTFIKIVQRIAIRDNPEDLRLHNSGFTNESFSDGYSYSLADPHLRALIMPNDEFLLQAYINDGQVVM